MSLVRRVPARIMPSVFDEVDRMFRDLWARPFTVVPALGGNGLPGPHVDVFETESEVVVKADLPGLQKENVEVTYHDGQVQIQGEVCKDEEVNEEGYHRRERRHGTFARTVVLPSEVNEEALTAKFENGVLEIRAPKVAATATQKKIEIQ